MQSAVETYSGAPRQSDQDLTEPKAGVRRGPSIVTLTELPVFRDPRGNLSFVESSRHVPFDIARVYYLYDVPSGSMRAGHAHKELKQLLFAVSGSFDVHVSDGFVSEVITLNRPNVGLLMSSMIWRELHNFSSGSVCMVLASMPYVESDYIRDHEEFLRIARGGK